MRSARVVSSVMTMMLDFLTAPKAVATRSSTARGSGERQKSKPLTARISKVSPPTQTAFYTSLKGAESGWEDS